MFNVGQRAVSAFVFLVLTIGAFILGKEFSPESLLDVLSTLVVPLATIGGTAFFLFKAIQKRVNDPEDPFEAGNLKDLLKSGEFRTALVIAFLGLAPVLGIQLDDAQKEVVINLVLGVMTLVLGVPVMQSLAVRPAKYNPFNTPKQKMLAAKSTAAPKAAA